MSDEQERKPKRRGDIRLRAKSGVIIDHSLPLHEAIVNQWRNGELHRVDDDGMPWRHGDEFDLQSAWDRRGEETQGGSGDPQEAAAGGSGPDGEFGPEPVRPPAAAPVKAWREYAVALGACEKEEAAGMSRDELVKLVTPPELDPLTPKE